MTTILYIFWDILVTLARLSRPGGLRRIVAQQAMIKHQTRVVMRSRKRAPELNPMDRFILGLLAFFIPKEKIQRISVVVKPSTIMKFHQALAKRKYSRLFSAKNKRKPGPKGPSQELIKLIVEIKTNNPCYGYPRIADIVNNYFGTDIEPDIVRRILAKHYKPTLGGDDGPSWLAFIGLMKDSLWSMDLFVCESINLKTHWVLVIMDQHTRRIIGFTVNVGPVDGSNLCRMFNEIISDKCLPKYISRDNDPLYKYHQFQANMHILKDFDGVEQIRSVPYTPTSHPFVERLIGSIRREFLNKTLFWNHIDLTKKLDQYKDFYNNGRVHRSLCGQIPNQWAGDQTIIQADFNTHRWKTWCRGLYKMPIAA